MKKLLALAIILVIGIFVSISIVGTGAILVKSGKYTIKKGDTLTNLPERFDLKINKTFYKVWLKTVAPKVSLKAGTFTLVKDMALNEFLLNKANSPDTLDKEITILPGWNIFDIDEMLAYKSIITSGDLVTFSKNLPESLVFKYPFLKGHTLEGFIYPDTYRVALDANLEKIIDMTLAEFGKKIYSNYNSKIFYENLVMASIVEKEERNTDNKPVVAGILEKRLNEGIAIGADATVCYQYEVTSSNCTPEFIGEMIYKKSKYNTREQTGLPPTPISNMTNDTFAAVVNPKKSEYYFYLHDMKGQIHYATNLKEHNINKNLYIK